VVTDHRKHIRDLIEFTSLAQVARELRIAQTTLAKYVAGLPINESTELLIDKRLSEINHAE